MVSLVLIAMVLGLSGLALSGKPIRLPVWIVAEVETRLNRAISPDAGRGSLSVGAIELMVDTDWVPRLALEDLRVLQPDGTALLTLPEVHASFDPSSLLKGTFRPQSLRIIGGRLAVKRGADGQFDLDFGTPIVSRHPANLADILEGASKVFANPILAQLTKIEAEALTIILTDARTGRQWQAGDGRIVLVNSPNDVAAEVSLSLAVDQSLPSRVVLTAVSQKETAEARIVATVDAIAARDLASQVTPLAWLGALDAPISGRLAGTIDANGQLGPLESSLEIGAGVLRPTPQTAPIAFERAGLTLSYAPKEGRLAISSLTVESQSLRLSAAGQSYILDAEGVLLTGNMLDTRPASFLTQLTFSQVMVDPAGLFEAPVRFSKGALDLRLSLNPFAIDIGQMTLTEDDHSLALKGRVAADPDGWRVALDVALDKIDSGQLIALWPVRLVAKTREWLALNVLEGTLVDVRAAVRLQPGAEPRLSLGYKFEETDVRFLKELPPIKAASGYSSMEGRSYSLVLEKGYVSPPLGGNIDVTGTVVKISDINAKPTQAEITLVTQSSLTAALSLLDQPPFGFLTKAKRPVDLGQGRANLVTKLSFPLKAKVLLEDVRYNVSGEITDFQSDKLVASRQVNAPKLTLTAGPSGMAIVGKGLLDSLPFDVTYQQAFGPAAKGRAEVEGSVTVTDAILRDLGIDLPNGMISGSAQGNIKITLPVGAPAQLTFASDLQGLGLQISALGWSKPAAVNGKLDLVATLGQVPEITSLRFDGAGLKAVGAITLQTGGGLKVARFSTVKLDDWLDAVIALEGRGKGRSAGVTIESGIADLRRLAVKSSSARPGADGPLQVSLDRLSISDGIELTDFRGNFTSVGGFNGKFTARVNGKQPVRGTVVPSRAGSAVRITSDDAGRVMAAAGVFKDARGGAFDLQLVPTGAKGEYKGSAKIGTIRVKNASVLAELLSAISVVGLLEQLNENGLVFTQADVDFRLTPDAVEVTRGSAIGASLGVSMAGVYRSGTKRLSLQGVISPIYLLNGIGSFLTRKGEGLFGFNYKIRGTVDAPNISVNPLSILTPGMFRELFRKPAPKLPASTE